jgi:hypothetical protein
MVALRSELIESTYFKANNVECLLLQTRKLGLKQYTVFLSTLRLKYTIHLYYLHLIYSQTMNLAFLYIYTHTVKRDCTLLCYSTFFRDFFISI